jgi:hypothetical protein
MQLEVDFFSAQPDMPQQREWSTADAASVWNLLWQNGHITVTGHAVQPHMPTTPNAAAGGCTAVDPPVTGPAGKVQLLVADFDDTCTEKDTIGLLLAAAAEAAGRVRLGGGPADCSSGGFGEHAWKWCAAIHLLPDTPTFLCGPPVQATAVPGAFLLFVNCVVNCCL